MIVVSNIEKSKQNLSLLYKEEHHLSKPVQFAQSEIHLSYRLKQSADYSCTLKIPVITDCFKV